MEVQPTYYLDFDPENPKYEENIQRLAEKYPDHPRVQQHRRLVAGGKVELADGMDQDDDAWCKEMVQLAVQSDPESDSQQTDDGIIRQFCDGTGIFAD